MPDETPSRRKMLSLISAIFDPLGLIAPVAVRGRLLLQEATMIKLDWDEMLPRELQQRWSDWLSDIQHLHALHFPRCMKPFKTAVSELHVFSDASELAYGCCAYLRNVLPDGTVHLSLIVARCRIAPLKQMSVPRLELEGAVMAAKMSAVLQDELDIALSNVILWVDSQPVLKYISSQSRRFKTFVANRVSLIHQLTDLTQWRYVPSDMNAADLLSRGGSVDLVNQSDWISGPKFLLLPPTEWPSHGPSLDALNEPEHEVNPELKSKSISSFACSQQQMHPIDQMSLHYSEWLRLRKAIAWMLRLKETLKKKASQENSKCAMNRGPAATGAMSSKSLSVQELRDAERAIIMHVQNSHFSSELQRLQSGEPVHANSTIKSLDPFLSDDGLLRVGGRLRRAQIECHPILVPHEHVISSRIALEYHNAAHLGVECVGDQSHSREVLDNACSLCS